MTNASDPVPPPLPNAPSERLDSWKEIARYLRRDESTAQRWEKREGMPVHRHLHDKRGSVYAYRRELEAWWQSRGRRLDPSGNQTEDYAAIVNGAAPPSGAAGARFRRLVQVAVLLALAAGALVAFTRLRAPSRRATESLVRLTSTSGLNIDPALSPDGSLLAYASDRGGSGDLDIWIQPTTGETPIRVTTQPGDDIEPSFAPDGASIVFARGEAGGIYVVGTTGGEPRLLASAVRAHGPRFSPDGKWVTFWTGLPLWAVRAVPRAGGALFVIPAQGGTPRPLASGLAAARQGIWSPTGDRILFLGELREPTRPPSLDWYVVDVGTGMTVRTGAIDRLRDAGLKGVPIPATWTRDGVIFASYDEGASNVWQLPLSPATNTVNGVPIRLTFGTAIERSPSTSVSGRLVFSSIVENVDIWRVPLDSVTGLAAGSLERITDNAARDSVENLSADGRLMGFLSSRTGREEAWTRDLQTRREHQITTTNADGVRLSRDGSMIAVGRVTAENRGVDLVPIGGGPESPLCNDCEAADWSPDGTRVLFQQGKPARLVVREIRTGREVVVAAHPSWNLFQARFSPDGRWIVFHTTNTPTLRQIYVVPAGVDAPVPVEKWIPVVKDFGVQPNWSSDGRRIYYFSLRDGAFCAWAQPVDPESKRPAGPPRAVQHFHDPRLRAAYGAQASNAWLDTCT